MTEQERFDLKCINTIRTLSMDADPAPGVVALNRRYNRYLPLLSILAHVTGVEVSSVLIAENT